MDTNFNPCYWLSYTNRQVYLQVPFYIPSVLKVVSSENYGGSKMAPIVGFWPGTVALGIIFKFWFPVGSYWTYFRSRSVQQNLLAISIPIGEALRLVVCASPILLFPLCSTNTIGPAICSPLIGEAQRIRKKSAKTSHWPYEFAMLRLFARWRHPNSPLSAGGIVVPITIHIAP